MVCLSLVSGGLRSTTNGLKSDHISTRTKVVPRMLYNMSTTAVHRLQSVGLHLSQDNRTQIQGTSMSDQTKYREKLKGDHVLVIGGSSGLGYAAAEAAHEHGSRITISSSSQKRLDDAISALKKSYPSASSRVAGYPCNLADETTLENNVQELFKKVGSVDHVIFTAGDSLAQIPLQDATLAKIKQAGMVRFFAPIIVAKEAAKYLSPGPKSSITLTTGAVSERPIPGWAVVGAWAGGLHAMMRGLALDLKPVRVNLISPGTVDTEMWAGLSEETKKAIFADTEGVMTTGKIGKAADVAEAYMYCLRDQNLTGSVISTNGGVLLTGWNQGSRK